MRREQRHAWVLLVGAVCGAATGVGCTAPTPQEELAAFTRATGTLVLPDDVRREAVQAYAPHARHVAANDAWNLLVALHEVGLRRAELTAGFGVAIEALEGTGTAHGTLLMLRWLFRPGASPSKVQDFLRVRRDAAVAKAHEGVTVKGVQKLVALHGDLADVQGYLEGLPAAKAAGIEGEAFDLYYGLWKLRLPGPLRAECYRHGIGAGARKMDLGEYLWFVGELRRWNRADAELLAYVGQLTRSGGPTSDRSALANGFDAVGLLPIPEPERVRLFGGTLAAVANGADPDGTREAIRALSAAKVPPELLPRMVEATLQALARYPAAAVTVAVEKALASRLEGEALAEELSAQLSRAAAGGRHGRPARE